MATSATPARRRQPPPVDDLGAGIWQVPVPIPDNPLGWTVVYLIDTDRGPVLVDTGWNDPATLRALEEGVATAGHRLEDVHGVLVTHFHADHHGLAGVVRERSGAWVALHPADAAVVTEIRTEPSDQFARHATVSLLRAGADELDLAELPAALGPPPLPPAVPDRLVADGQTDLLPGRESTVLHTPGHTPGHVCLHLPRERRLLTGDHVLPRITPTISMWRPTDGDPLGDFMASLRRLRGLPVDLVLPAHLRPFRGLDERLDELLAHHEQRLDEVRAAVADGPRTTWEVTAAMSWNRPWEELNPFLRRLALAEAMSHIRRLERAGEVEVSDDVPHTVTPTSATPGTPRTAASPQLALHNRRSTD